MLTGHIISDPMLWKLKFQSVIISKPFGIDGAESGANSSNVSIGITWTDGENLNESYDSTTLTRYNTLNHISQFPSSYSKRNLLLFLYA